MLMCLLFFGVAARRSGGCDHTLDFPGDEVVGGPTFHSRNAVGTHPTVTTGPPSRDPRFAAARAGEQVEGGDRPSPPRSGGPASVTLGAAHTGAHRLGSLDCVQAHLGHFALL